MTSPDGITWTARASAVANAWQSVTFGNGLFLAVSNSGTANQRVMISPDGIIWQLRTIGEQNWRSVTFNNGLFVAVATSGNIRVMTSPDALGWYIPSIGSGNFSTNNWQSVVRGTFAGQNMTVAVANTGSDTNRVMYSNTGTTIWVETTSNSCGQTAHNMI